MPINIPDTFHAKTLILDGLAQADIDMAGHKLLNLDTSNLPPSGIPPTVHPPANQWLHDWDAVTKVWTATRPDFTHLSGFLTETQKLNINMVGTINVGNWRGTALLADKVPRLDLITTPAGDLTMANFKITNLGDPISPGDAVNKRFMDFLLQGLSVKEAVRVASVTTHFLVGLQTIDGVAVQAGDRVLLKNQDISRPGENGIWIASTGAWTRAADTPFNAAGLERAYCTVTEGTVNDGTSWVEVTDLTDPLNTSSPIKFVLFASNLGGAGEPGPPGPPGSNGQGVPVGGTAGQILTKIDATDFNTHWVSAALGVPFAFLQTTQIGTPGTTSTAGVMAGLGAVAGNQASITPISSNKVLVTISGSMFNNTAVGTVFAQVRYGTGAAPAHGSPLAGTAKGGTAIRGPMSGSVAFVPFSLSVVLSGLSLGTSVWLDLAYGVTGGGGTAILSSIAVTATEIP